MAATQSVTLLLASVSKSQFASRQPEECIFCHFKFSQTGKPPSGYHQPGWKTADSETYDNLRSEDSEESRFKFAAHSSALAITASEWHLDSVGSWRSEQILRMIMMFGHECSQALGPRHHWPTRPGPCYRNHGRFKFAILFFGFLFTGNREP